MIGMCANTQNNPINAVSVCRNASAMPENKSYFSFKDTSFGVSFFAFYRFFGFCFYFYYYFAKLIKSSTAFPKADKEFPVTAVA